VTGRAPATVPRHTGLKSREAFLAEGRIEAARPARPPIYNDPRYRAIFYQVLVLGGVFLAAAYLVNNTLANLERQGIASGFDFLNRTAGFSISMTLIDYNEEMTYGRAFLVSLINTLVVSAIGVVLATILGFIVGVARLSTNWLLARMAAVYIETLRNLPILLQIFFWYFAVLRAVPGPKQSLVAFDLFFLNNRGLQSPAPIFEESFGWIVVSVAVAIVAIIFVARWAKKRRDETGQQFHTVYTSLAILIGLPLIAAVATGFPLSWSVPVLKGFNFQGGMTLIPEFVALVFALSLYTATFIAEIVRAGIMAVPTWCWCSRARRSCRPARRWRSSS
jgi:general L-amino acid transport system permease protein